MKIKRHLPCAPFPPSKPIRNVHYYVNHAGELVYNGRSPLDNVAHIDISKCVGCKVCMGVCPEGAIYPLSWVSKSA